MDDVTQGNADIVQVPIGPLSEFTPVAHALTPNVKSLAKLDQDPRTMIIYHLLM
jgi:hypothetical protein